MRKTILLFILLLGHTLQLAAQTPTASLRGKVVDEKGNVVEGATIAIVGTVHGTTSNSFGEYNLEAPANKNITFAVSFLGLSTYKKVLKLSENEEKIMNVTLEKQNYTFEEFIKKDNRARYEMGSLYLDPEKIAQLPSTVGGVEGLIKTFVGGNNELTSQYSVRGGNFDENLVYINDFEVYRPFLVRSGQQEGLSVINPDLVGAINFSLGGFGARYGDKMSSVLNIDYKRPRGFAGSVNLSLLGAGLHLEGLSKNKKLSFLFGARQKSNQYLLQSQPTKGVYNPSFTDVQALIQYRPSDKWEWQVLGNYARNRFTFSPETFTASFGLVNEAYQLQMYYDGGEIDQFDSKFGGISSTFKPNHKVQLKLLASGFSSDENETYDIWGEYLLGQLETDPGKKDFNQIKTYLGTGAIQTHARNYLQMNVGNLSHKGNFDAGKHFLLWGAGVQFVSINDKLNEWERRDSAGFTQPYQPEHLEMKKYYNSRNSLDYQRYTAYLQDNYRPADSLDLTISAGVRINHSTLNNETLLSPRVQISFRPKWKNDIVFKLSGGKYVQPPLYREMRNINGQVNTNVKAQKSLHFAAGTDYNFFIGTSRFKFTTEFYYKKLWDLVPYEYDNVRIRYFGDNLSKGYAYGGELRLYGDLVPDAPSWISIGVMNTKEDLINDQIVYQNQSGLDSAIVYPGYVPRPADQRLMLGMFFQDYLPNNKNFRAHLNLMYATGLPFGPPDQQRYADTLRLPDYKRMDIGFSALILDPERKERPSKSVFNQLRSIWLSAEMFNIFGIQNTISYNYIQDQSTSRTYLVPNRLTSRLLNVKLIVKF